ncbi:hypothetical protein PROFUN_11931 [Planoprotostelium fungivorum]|uniref:Ankyrin repeat protein n=1 Tax=Planoprotostelium fungivorum TaxID=1890364 RepID=A0A2P6N8U6_9EUKA|nr:hypothetical protein PROFUN_11931 [Planoprotostelium fungivorum]
MMELLDDFWADILPFFTTSDLCVPCFTSKALRDLACRIIDSRVPNVSYWWYRQKVLPVYNVEIVRWWLRAIREPTNGELKDAATRDDLDVVEVLGWSSKHCSPRHRYLLSHSNQRSCWNQKFILKWALVSGSKRIINVCHKRGAHLIPSACQSDHVFQHIYAEGNLERIQWMYDGKQVDGLPSIPRSDIPNHPHVYWPLAKKGHTDVILWLKEKGVINPQQGARMYEAAGMAGRMDMIEWLVRGTRERAEHKQENNQIPCDFTELCSSHFTSSFSTFDWIRKHDAFDSGFLYTSAVCNGSVEGICKNFGSIALQLAIDHKLLTKETKIELRIDNNLPTIKWLYERDILQPDLSK